MHKTLITILLCAVSMIAAAQTTDFDKAYDACIKVNDGLAGGFADAEQLSAAANTLKSLKVGNLSLKQIQGEKKSLNGHLLFKAEFINDLIKNQAIYELADKYAQHTRKRGIRVPLSMTTVMIPAHKTYVYEYAGCDGEVNLGCVAETNGLMSWRITTTEYESKANQTYRDNKDEKKGRASRRMAVKSDKKYKIKIEITNTSDCDSSFAILISEK